jgi:hypothetical protein
MKALGWDAVQGIVLNGIMELYHGLQHVKSSQQFNKVVAELYVHGDPLVSALAVSLLVSVVVWALGLATNKHSWVGPCFTAELK